MHVFAIYCVLCLVLTKQLGAHKIQSPENDLVVRLLTEDSKVYLGSSIILNEKELKANEILMRYKEKEFHYSFHNPNYYNFSKHYFTYKKDIPNSKVYQIIQKMPKGAALHIHSSLMLHSADVMELTYEDHLYVCYNKEDYLDLQFSLDIPDRPCQYNWTLLSEIRALSYDVKAFDAHLRRFFTLYTEEEKIMNADINLTWTRFREVSRAIKALIAYRPLREKFIYRALKNFYNDNVMYIEIRTGLHNLYELDGKVHSKMHLAVLYQRVVANFRKIYPDFIGVKLILTEKRDVKTKKIQEALAFARKLKEEWPNFFAGFDLVGQEDLGKPLKKIMPVLLEAKADLNFFFHGGETNWIGTSSDENLFYAFALGSKRLGHAFALIKHPSLLALAHENDIAVEANVISNVVLSLVRDVRNHPLATYLALGYPVVLSSDDPGAWDAEPLSHDFYVTFMGVASKRANLRLLKQLALNSLNYSSLSRLEKNEALKKFDRQWNEFIDYVIKYFSDDS